MALGKMDSRYDFKRLEERTMKRWKEMDLYSLIKKSRANGKKFYFLDGPPYVNDYPHAGQALTRALRDPILRRKSMQGHNVWLQPGYDCHGLPIEVKVEAELGLKTKDRILEYGVDKFLEKCRERADKFVDVFNDFWASMGMVWDFGNSYKTMDNDYISASWKFFKKAYEKKLLYIGLKSVAWCPRCETPLSGYEVTDEYRDTIDEAIFVKFPVEGQSHTYILIWTTTPWTIPGNMAVMVNENFEYAKVRVRGQYWIFGKELVDKVMEMLHIDDYEIVDTIKGKDLLGLEYEHPLAEEIPYHKKVKHKVITDDSVTLEEGTGCVHCAPGHGPEDYNAGVRNDIPIFSPVGDNGDYTEEAGKYKGLNVCENANEAIVEELDKKGVLPFTHKISHRYPHCWRCQHKLIFRASEQWFVDVDPVKKKMLKENAEVRWVPEYAGKKRFRDWLENARDWCISRQRYWGTPLPIWKCKKCGKFTVSGSAEEMKDKALKMPESPMDLHKPWLDKVVLKCDNCGSEANRVPDIADVWFDSGASTWAAFGYYDEGLFERFFPIDFITEGLDQTRGWFYTLMFEGVIMFDESPYKSVLMNAFVLDEKGDKMSKKLGNVIRPQEIIEKHGADAMRLYLLLDSNPWDELRFSWGNVELTAKSVNIAWNVFNYAKKYMDMHGVDPRDIDAKSLRLRPEDRWLLSRTQTVTEEIDKAYDDLNPHEMALLLREFMVEDLSRKYVKFVRKRLKEGEATPEVYHALYTALERLIYLMAPVMPFMAEGLYHAFVGGKKSVHLCDWPGADKSLIDRELEKRMGIVSELLEAGFSIRHDTGVKVRWPVRKAVVKTDSKEAKEAVSTFESLLMDQLNTKKIEVNEKPAKKFKGTSFSRGELFLDMELDDELLSEAYAREVTRRVQESRKKMDLVESDAVEVNVVSESSEFLKLLEKHIGKLKMDTNSSKITLSDEPRFKGHLTRTEIDGVKVEVILKQP
jgi:isoleucyl-tRNA synthetase